MKKQNTFTIKRPHGTIQPGTFEDLLTLIKNQTSDQKKALKDVLADALSMVGASQIKNIYDRSIRREETKIQHELLLLLLDKDKSQLSVKEIADYFKDSNFAQKDKIAVFDKGSVNGFFYNLIKDKKECCTLYNIFSKISTPKQDLAGKYLFILLTKDKSPLPVNVMDNYFNNSKITDKDKMVVFEKSLAKGFYPYLVNNKKDFLTLYRVFSEMSIPREPSLEKKYLDNILTKDRKKIWIGALRNKKIN
jgi:hypothetical protein